MSCSLSTKTGHESAKSSCILEREKMVASVSVFELEFGIEEEA